MLQSSSRMFEYDDVVAVLPHLVVFHVCNRCNVDAGDRLISVNDVKLQGLSHASTIDILQNAPDDVTLVVSQPKERLYKGKGREMIVAVMHKIYVFCFCSMSSNTVECRCVTVV